MSKKNYSLMRFDGNPCNGCKERFIGCHAVCERYINAKKAHDELVQKKRDEDDLNYLTSRRYKRRKADV